MIGLETPHALPKAENKIENIFVIILLNYYYMSAYAIYAYTHSR